MNNNSFLFQCPNCDLYIEVRKDQINCSIFRHGFFYEKINNTINLTSQMNPHTPKNICEDLVKQNKIYGCGKPFKLIVEAGECKPQVCDYI
jgi:hypothetical protein